MKLSKILSERKLHIFYAATIVLIAVVLLVGVLVFRFYMNNFNNDDTIREFDRYYVMITDDTRSSFWKSVYKGAYERGIENGVYVELLGDTLSGDYSCAELMDIAIASNVDGIMVYGDESEEMTVRIDMAVKAGIPVVTLYNDCTLSGRCSFVGVGGYNIGREYGKQILKLQRDKADNSKNQINISVLSASDQDDAQLGVIVSGLQETLEQENTSDVAYSISFVNVDNSNAFSAEESIRDIFLEDNVPDIILCLNELNTTCAYQAAVDYNMVGDVDILGYYDSDTILNAIDHNVIYATASIDTGQMGQFCVDALEEYNELGNTSQYFTANVTIINSDNISDYLKKEENNE